MIECGNFNPGSTPLPKSLSWHLPPMLSKNATWSSLSRDTPVAWQEWLLGAQHLLLCGCDADAPEVHVVVVTGVPLGASFLNNTKEDLYVLQQPLCRYCLVLVALTGCWQLASMLQELCLIVWPIAQAVSWDNKIKVNCPQRLFTPSSRLVGSWLLGCGLVSIALWVCVALQRSLQTTGARRSSYLVGQPAAQLQLRPEQPPVRVAGSCAAAHFCAGTAAASGRTPCEQSEECVLLACVAYSTRCETLLLIPALGSCL
jgi:hypothetical protein